MEDVMPLFLDDDTYYISMMKRFLHENEIEKLKGCVEHGDYELAMNFAYDLKALTGTLGLQSGFEASKNMCLHLHEREFEKLNQDIEQVRESYRKLNAIF